MSDPPLTTAADWPHHDMLAKGWVVFGNGYAVSTAYLGEKGQPGPHQIKHPTIRVGQEPCRFGVTLPWWRVAVLSRDMVSRLIDGCFATEADAREIGDLILGMSDAWDAPR